MEEDQTTAIQLTNTMSNSLKGRPVQGRIYEGKESPQFVALFQPMVVLKGGLSTGYKNLITDKDLSDETYTEKSIALIRISGTSIHNNKAVQVDAVPSSLNSTECFVLQTSSTIFIWHGNQGSFEQQHQAEKVAEFLRPGVTLKHAKEGTENSAFWLALGGEKQSYTSKKVINEVEEIYNFSQDDLLTEDIHVLDTHAEVFLWLGQCVDPKDKQDAFEIGQKYIDMTASLEGLSPRVPLYKVTEGNEPFFFTTYFSWDWDYTRAKILGNSFQKKASIFFATGHALELLRTARSTNSLMAVIIDIKHDDYTCYWLHKHLATDKSNGPSGGEPRQRAEALAALTSAFNSASEKTSLSQERLNELIQGGPRQRAEALAALNSAFNSSSTTKKVTPRPSAKGQGSQRAAAVAALSSVLTAENKQSPDASPRASRSPIPESSLSESGIDEAGSEIDEAESEHENVEDGNNDQSSQLTFSYDQLKTTSGNDVSGIDHKRREAYLSDEEFQTVFGMVKEDFYKLPRWKQEMLKKKLELF
ncbi:villin-2-like protein [Trifolium pratense]|uniref:Villin-2-like protein n=2 Tax=Trifolium TaxID=3898 RepID=A0A2K3NZK6_TRIPR|nr:villin-2-like protein [Trifolium pratense]